ncbi:MAG: cytochrome b/b6 domain-containing protein [Anaerolineales bacterium]|nr:cytochrome b/b6 domain-containing protein [Anaerolineales bacterium]
MPSTYNRTAQILHWLSALLIIALAVFGTIMVRLDDTVAMKTTMYRTHTLVGSLVLLLTIARIVWLFVGKRPSPLPMPGWEQQAFVWNHRLLYVILLALTLSGVAMLLASGVSLPPVGLTPADIQNVPPRQGHDVFSKLLIALFLMHLGGVFYYQFTKGDTLGRMGLNLNKR